VAALDENRRRAEVLVGYLRGQEAAKVAARAARWLEAHVGRALGPGPGRTGRPTGNSPRAGTSLVPDQRAGEFRQIARWALLEPDPEVVRLVDGGRSRREVLLRIASRTPVPSTNGRRRAVVAQAEEEEEGPLCWRPLDGAARVDNADFRDYLPSMPSRTVDLIITDPPYARDSLHLVRSLAAEARRLLTPNGLLLMWSGKVHLDEAMDALGEHLRYGWTFALLLPGVNNRIVSRRMSDQWKPVLAYSSGSFPQVWPWGGDVLTSPNAQQGDLAWAQSVEPAQELIERFTAPNALVLDPMCGTGAFGEAALACGRRFLGVEVAADRAEAAMGRLALPA